MLRHGRVKEFCVLQREGKSRKFGTVVEQHTEQNRAWSNVA